MRLIKVIFELFDYFPGIFGSAFFGGKVIEHEKIGSFGSEPDADQFWDIISLGEFDDGWRKARADRCSHCDSFVDVSCATKRALDSGVKTR
ncbi:hypothetical protein TMatcc_005536 [Talaromyces marneffei ATCC 18224]